MHSKDMLSNKKHDTTSWDHGVGHHMIFKNGKRRNSIKSNIYIYARTYSTYVLYVHNNHHLFKIILHSSCPENNIFIDLGK